MDEDHSIIGVRLHIDPLAREQARKGILRGLHLYMGENGFNPHYTLFNWNQAHYIERQMLNARGQIDADGYLNYLSEEKEDIANSLNPDSPHWDFVITHRDLCPASPHYNFIFGGFQGFYNSGWPDLASAVISTHRLRSASPQLEFERGLLISYHEVSHLKRDWHCEDEGCIHYSALGGLEDLDRLIPFLRRTGFIPKCDIHK